MQRMGCVRTTPRAIVRVADDLAAIVRSGDEIVRETDDLSKTVRYPDDRRRGAYAHTGKPARNPRRARTRKSARNRPQECAHGLPSTAGGASASGAHARGASSAHRQTRHPHRVIRIVKEPTRSRERVSPGQKKAPGGTKPTGAVCSRSEGHARLPTCNRKATRSNLLPQAKRGRDRGTRTLGLDQTWLAYRRRTNARDALVLLSLSVQVKCCVAYS
jgi:hypothetical protein